MRIPLAGEIPEMDLRTRNAQHLSPLELVERASERIFEVLLPLIPLTDGHRPEVHVLAGRGGNGADALVVARRLLEEGWRVCASHLGGAGCTRENLECLERFLSQEGARSREILSLEDLPVLAEGGVILDGLLGSGTRRTLEGLEASLVDRVNLSSPRMVFSIDMPSGLMGEEAVQAPRTILRADHTLAVGTFKLSHLLADNHPWVGKVHLVDIGLDAGAIRESTSPYHLTTSEDLVRVDLSRDAFAHKGAYGRGLLLAGKRGMGGAALLAALSALRSGIGLLTVHVPRCNRLIIQSTVWEATISEDVQEDLISTIPSLKGYTAIAMGPGIGQDILTGKALGQLLDKAACPLVLDADALNLMALNRHLLERVPPGSILTPHPAEMDRLLGSPSLSGLDRLQKARRMAMEHGWHIILKGQLSAVILGSGTVRFNPSGNAAMATAGSGDVLTGLILALLARGVSAEEAAVTGAWIHGRSGDLMLEKTGQNAMMARDLIQGLSLALAGLERRKLEPTLWM